MTEAAVGARPLVAVSLKMYLSAAATRSWVRAVRDAVAARPDGGPEVAVLPSFPLLESTAATLAGSGIAWGAQDLAPGPAGAQTGEVSGAVLAELGCTYVEIGHAERRRLFAEGPETLGAKVEHALESGLVPIYCTGEPEPGAADAAAARCVADVVPVARAAARHGSALVVAYEPVWAIGAAEPAPADHVRTVCHALRDAVVGTCPVRVLYGGSAGPGTWADLQPDVDGLFLGRFVHDPANLAAVLDEVAATSTTTPV